MPKQPAKKRSVDGGWKMETASSINRIHVRIGDRAQHIQATENCGKIEDLAEGIVR